MKEIKLTIPEGCKSVTVKVDGEQVTTEFEPKEKKWEPKDGDFLISKFSGTLVIYADTENDGIITYSGLGSDGTLTTEKGLGWGFTKWYRPATESERMRLLGKLKSEGYIWNAEEKKLEKLPRWRAEFEGKYYYINDKGDVRETEEDDCYADKVYYKAGNYFRTREAAEKVAEQIRGIFKNSKPE